jgi:MoxR-like ATPase
MPADIIGTNILIQNQENKRQIEFQKGPIFANIIMADEINRATPKTQSAMLEAMQEQTVTIGIETHKLLSPFIVLATQNPIEMEGTYPLPEAQLDRFFFKLKVKYPSASQINEIIDKTTRGSLPKLQKIVNAKIINEMRIMIKEIPIAEHVKNYAIRIVLATRPDSEFSTALTNKYIRYGSSPRGAQSLVLAGKVYAFLDSRFNVSFDDIKKAARPGLRHRIILNFEGEAEGINAEDIIDNIIATIPKKEKKSTFNV